MNRRTLLSRLPLLAALPWVASKVSATAVSEPAAPPPAAWSEGGGWTLHTISARHCEEDGQAVTYLERQYRRTVDLAAGWREEDVVVTYRNGQEIGVHFGSAVYGPERAGEKAWR
jgi:hypothetical protein